MMAPDWVDWDLRHCWHPYTNHLLAPVPVPVSRAKGAYLYTPDGRPILDAISSWWVNLHGHAHPTIAAAIARQASELPHAIFAGCTHEPAARLARRLAAILPEGLERFFFSDDGSTAVEAAIKMAVQYWANRGEPRRTLVAFEHGYHGDTVGAMSASARSPFTRSFEPLLFPVERIPSPADDAGASLRALERVLGQRGRDVAALILEPLVQGAGGMRMFGEETLRRTKALCEHHETLLIADEVMTGFGRTGAMFACGKAGISPDILCLSKGLTGGFLPLALTVCRAEISTAFEREDPSATFFHGHSYTANPLGCAAALASLDVFEEEPVFERIAEIEAAHADRLPALARSPKVSAVRNCGTIAAVELRAPDPGYLSGLGRRLASFYLERGVLLRPLGNVVYLLPPYVVSREELDRVYDLVEESLTVV